MQNPKEQEVPKGNNPTFNFKLPPDTDSMPVLGKDGALNMPEEFNPHLTKKEFNFYLIQNLTPLVQLTYGLINEVEKLRKRVDELKVEKKQGEGNDVY